MGKRRYPHTVWILHLCNKRCHVLLTQFVPKPWAARNRNVRAEDSFEDVCVSAGFLNWDGEWWEGESSRWSVSTFTVTAIPEQSSSSTVLKGVRPQWPVVKATSVWHSSFSSCVCVCVCPSILSSSVCQGKPWSGRQRSTLWWNKEIQCFLCIWGRLKLGTKVPESEEWAGGLKKGILAGIEGTAWSSQRQNFPWELTGGQPLKTPSSRVDKIQFIGSVFHWGPEIHSPHPLKKFFCFLNLLIFFGCATQFVGS